MPRLDGIDGSHYQPDAGPVDLAAVAAIPTFWWAWKATQSTAYVDPTFAPMWADAKQRFAQRLAYHWLSSTRDPLPQAALYLKTVGPLQPGEGCMLDAEEGGITADACLDWCELVEATTRRPVVVYSGLYVAGGSIWKSPELRTSRFGPRPFIVAAYLSEAKLAERMISTGSQAFPYQAWQYSSNGPVPGIVGRCDMDMVLDRAAFDLACGITITPTPTPTPVPPSTEDDMQIRLLILTDSDAQFLAETTADGRALNCRWADGSAKTQAVVAAHRASAAGKQAVFEQPGDIAGLANVYLDGVLPVGDSKHAWNGQEFAGVDAAATGTVDAEARAAFERQDALIVKLNDAVGRTGQEIYEVRVGLGKLAPT